jgi:hypothetical protein
MPVGQLIYFTIDYTKLITPYYKKESAKYVNKEEMPMGSKMYKNEF